jgi:hypothetical protein
MRRALTLAALLSAARAFAGPVGGADAHAVSATGFPGAYLGTVSLSLAADPMYGSRLLDAFSMHLQAVSVMTAPPEVAAYLEQSATGGGDLKKLRGALGRESLDPPKASALLLANALARPEQFREVLDGLEQMKPGLGRHAASLLREAKGTGSRKLFEALHAAGAREPRSTPLTYGPDARLDRLFDGGSSGGRDGVVLDEPEPVAAPSAYGYGPDGRPRASGLSRSTRP